jgi:hypothetical protein
MEMVMNFNNYNPIFPPGIVWKWDPREPLPAELQLSMQDSSNPSVSSYHVKCVYLTISLALLLFTFSVRSPAFTKVPLRSLALCPMCRQLGPQL